MAANMNSITPWRYSFMAVLLHWLMTIIIFGMIAMGWYMTSDTASNSPHIGFYFNTHKSFGMLIGILVILRLAWRFTHKPAPLPSSIPNWQVLAAHSVHWLLYLCMVLMPFTGFMGVSYGTYPVSFFGLPIPHIVNPNKDLSELFFTAHGYIVWALVGLIVLHTLAAFKHLLIDKDTVFQRMYF